MAAPHSPWNLDPLQLTILLALMTLSYFAGESSNRLDVAERQLEPREQTQQDVGLLQNELAGLRQEVARLRSEMLGELRSLSRDRQGNFDNP